MRELLLFVFGFLFIYVEIVFSAPSSLQAQQNSMGHQVEVSRHIHLAR